MKALQKIMIAYLLIFDFGRPVIVYASEMINSNSWYQMPSNFLYIIYLMQWYDVHVCVWIHCI